LISATAPDYDRTKGTLQEASLRLSMTRAVLATALAFPAMAQAADRGEAKATLAGKAVKVEYGRPALRGRDMLAQAQVGQPWRMGADGATTLATEADLTIGGVAVPKGTYVLTATKVAADKWQLNVTTNDEAKKKVAEVPLAVHSLDQSVELFTIDLKPQGDKADFQAAWGTTALRAPIAAR
jgi:hypothetical protein